MNSRRELLKLFGTGAVIAPIVAGTLIEEAKATIVEPPKVELVEDVFVHIEDGFETQLIKRVGLALEMADGSTRQFFSTPGHLIGQGTILAGADVNAMISLSTARNHRQQTHSAAWFKTVLLRTSGRQVGR